MAGAADKALDENLVVAEGSRSLAASLLQLSGKRRRFIDHPHATATTPKGCFYDEWKADFSGDLLCVPRILQRFLCTGNHGNTRPLRQTARRPLITEQIEQLRTGADEGDPGALAGARQRRIFGQETIAGMDCVDTFFPRQRDDALDVKISLHRTFSSTDQVSFVGLEAVQGETVFLRINCYRAEPEFVSGAKNAYCDFAAIES